MKRHSSQTESKNAAFQKKNQTELNHTEASAGGLNRRSVLKSLAGTAASAFVWPVVQVGVQASGEPSSSHAAPKAFSHTQNPRWYGFNLLEYFSTDSDWMNYFPYKNDGMFREDDFRWIRDWGFNFVRLPMDYRFWTDPNDLMKIDEKKVEPIDRAIRLGEKYGIHVSICLHRAPGYCVLDSQEPAIGYQTRLNIETGNLSQVHITVEKTNLFDDPQAQEAFAQQWRFFAKRYKGISSERLSFNLLNEPAVRYTRAERDEVAASSNNGTRTKPGEWPPLQSFRMGSSPSTNMVAEQILHDHVQEFVRVMRGAIEAIRSVDPQRLIVSDGCLGGVLAPDLPGIVQSCHDYDPTVLTLYKAEWRPQPRPGTWSYGFDSHGLTSNYDGPIYTGTWPIPDQHSSPPSDSWGGGRRMVFGRDQIEFAMGPWKELERQGVGIHFGETGCYKYTPHSTMLGWMEDTLHVMGEMHTGWALRNFRGPFGVLDTERAGAKFEDWHGHQLDRALLTLLQKHVSA
jgi:endoglucanase